MNPHEDSGAIADGIREMRVLTGALVAGALSFLLVVLVLRWGEAPDPRAAGDASTMIFPGVAMLNALLGLFLPYQQLPNRRRTLLDSLRAEEESGEPSTGDLINLLKGVSIVRLALLEGACFMTLISTMMTGNLWLLWFAGALLLLMLWGWPTVPSVTRWVLEQRELIRQES